MRIKYHITPRDEGRWAVIKEDSKRAIIVLENKQDAIERARELAKKVKLGQIFIHGRNGRIQEEYTYGQDPRKYPS
ncbi:DUF2188 domain-containing protein [Candidatus Pacearchaeota archaeon]|nr:MAG: DUF2188 domain-containing protein [Candidatus Pacearchaeota archaeon]